MRTRPSYGEVFLGRCPDCYKIFIGAGSVERELVVDTEIIALSLAHGAPISLRCDNCFNEYIDNLIAGGGSGVFSPATEEI